jgi:pantothenate synthetase
MQFGSNEIRDRSLYPREQDHDPFCPVGMSLVVLTDASEICSSDFQKQAELELPAAYCVLPFDLCISTPVVTTRFGIMRPHLIFFDQNAFPHCGVTQRVAKDLSSAAAIIAAPTVD